MTDKREEGDMYPLADEVRPAVSVIGPECFAAWDGSVLCWRGVNYVPQDDHQEGAGVLRRLARSILARLGVGGRP